MNEKSYIIFLADDDADDREFFENAIEEVNSDIILKSFANGELLCNHLAINSTCMPDIIFLDINMPVKNGFKCLEQIRNSEDFSDLCIIMYSTSNNKMDVQKSYDLGANGFVQKPFSFKELKKVLNGILDTDWKEPCNQLHELNFIIKSSSA